MTLQVLFDTGGANSVKNLKIGGISREIDKLDAEQCSRGWRYESCHHFRLENSISDLKTTRKTTCIVYKRPLDSYACPDQSR